MILSETSTVVVHQKFVQVNHMKILITRTKIHEHVV